MQDDNQPIGYDHNKDRRELEEAVEPLRKRIVAMEILLQQRDMKIRHLEEKIAENRSGLSKHDGRRPWAQPIDPNDQQ